MAETRNATQNKSLTTGQKWEVIYKLCIVAFLFGVFVTHVVIAVNIATYLKKFYDLLASNNFYWNIRWMSTANTVYIATKNSDTVRMSGL
ncbi:hypothetical protein CPB86DRAFT_784082 [Serendipita vermifera]|nr:hypothetical protein CPB86DRAFT_784082 [Serendipita vermifera]